MRVFRNNTNNTLLDSEHAHDFQVRGAPAIAIVGCLSLAVELKSEEHTDKKILRQDVEGKLNYLVSARPTAVNMKLAADKLIHLVNKLSKDESVNVMQMKERYGTNCPVSSMSLLQTSLSGFSVP